MTRSRRRLARLLAVTALVGGVGCVAAPAHATSDTTAPVLHSVSLASPGPFTAGDTVTVQWVATDDVGVGQVQVGYLDAAGHEKTVVGSAGSSSVPVTIDYRWANGLAAVRWVWVFDVNGNWTVYYPSGSWGASPSAQGTGGPDLHPLEFTAQATGEDVTAPLITALSRTTPAQRTAGDPVTLAWTATDAHVYWMQAVFVDAACKQHALGGNWQSTGTSTLTLDGTWADGPVQLTQVVLSDDTGNTRVYEPGGVERSSPGSNGPWTTGPTTPFDLATMGFVIGGGGGDTTPPTLTDVHLASPGPFHAGDAVAVDWTASDASGVGSVQLNVTDAAGKGHALHSTSSPTTTVIDDSWALGGVVVQSVEVRDTAGNAIRYRRDGTTDRLTGCQVPGTHAFDLSTLDFTVEAGPSDSSAPTATTTAPQRFPLVSAPVLSWTGADTGAGVASYDVRVTSASVSQGFGAWSRPAAWQGLTSTQKAFSLPQGVTRCLSVRARDNVGNVGAWSAARCATGAVDERALPRAGEWTTVRSASLLGGYGLRTSRLGDEVWSPYTTVRRVGVVASTCPTCGTVGVYVGDVLVGRLSLTSSVLKHQQVRALALPSTRSGVVSLRVLTSGRPVLVDGLLVSRV